MPLKKPLTTTAVPSHWAIRLFPRSAKAQAAIDQYLNWLRKSAEIKLNLGCGDHPIEGLINCDLYSECAEKKIDILHLDEFSSETVDHIEAHHLFEHLSFSERGPALREWHRVLRIGGRLVLSVPDLTSVCLLWLKHHYLTDHKVDAEGVNYVERMLYGPQTNPGMFHRSGYSRHSLVRLLRTYNFDIEFCATPYPIRPTPSLFVVAIKRG